MKRKPDTLLEMLQGGQTAKSPWRFPFDEVMEKYRAFRAAYRVAVKKTRSLRDLRRFNKAAKEFEVVLKLRLKKESR